MGYHVGVIPVEHHEVVKAVARALRRECSIPANTHLLVATSGGADSVALLRALAALAPRRKWNLKLTVGHVQHHLRDAGGDAEADAAFVQELAASLGLVFLRRDLDQEWLRGGNVEQRARHARYEALGAMAEACGAEFIATGHHGDDQLETILMRFLRGASMRGLRGIAWRRRLEPDSDVGLIRPLLGVERAAIRRFLTDLGQTWREDHTNLDVSRLRARLRQDVTPVLRAIRPDIITKANLFAAQMRWGTQLLNDSVADVLDEITFTDVQDHLCLDRVEARQLVDVVLFEVVREMLLDLDVPADALTVRGLMPLLGAICDRRGGRRRFPFAGGVTAVVQRDVVVFEETS